MKNILLPILIFITTITYAQNFQAGVSIGSGFMYVVEDLDESVATNYYNTLISQAELRYLDSNGLPRYGIAIYSNSVQSYNTFNRFEFYKGMITNTGLTFSKYFNKSFSENLLLNLQLGAGPNVERLFDNRTRYMLNINVAGELQYSILSKLNLQLKGMAVGQDLTNIVRYTAFGEWQEAGEDLQLFWMIGLAFDL